MKFILTLAQDIDEVFSLSPAKMLPQSKPRWSDLPIDIMGKLMEYLNSLEDHASLLAVCRNWRACVEECRFWRAPAYLLLPGGMMYGYPDFTPRYLNGSKGYSGSCEGSLLFSESGVDGPRHLLKYPPFTGFPWLLPRLFVTIRRGCGGSDGGSLLSQWWNDAKTMDVRKLVRCSDNTIAAILGSEYSARVAIYWTSRHVWFLADDQLRCYEDLAFCDGRLYALTVMEELWAFDIGNVNDGVGAAELIIRGPLPGHRVSAARYLVRSCASNALLMIRRQLELWPSHENAQVSVFRADLASSQWVEVTDLGGEALLVGRPCSRAVPAPAHDMEGTSRNVVKGNTILFATVDRVALPSLQGVSIYDMRNGVVKLRRVVRTNGPDSATWLFPREEFRLR